MARKIDTFNPMSGVSIPGWAIDSYQGTLGNLNDIVDSLTSEWKEARRDDMTFSLEAAKLRGEQDRFEQERDYQIEQDSIRNARLEKELQNNIRKDREDRQRADDIFAYEKNDADAKNWVSNFEKMTENFQYDDEGISAIDSVLNSYGASGNTIKDSAWRAQKAVHENKKQKWVDSGETIRTVFFDGISMDAIDESPGSRMKYDMFRKEYMNDPEFKNKISTYLLENEGVILSPLELDKKSSEFKNKLNVFRDASKGLVDIVASFGTQSTQYENAKAYVDDLKTDISREYQGESVGSEITPTIVRDYAVKLGVSINEARKKIEDKNLTSDQVLSEIIGPITIGDVENNKDSGFFDETFGTIGRYLSREETDTPAEVGKLAGEFVASPALAIGGGALAIGKGAQAVKDFLTIEQDEHESFVRAGTGIEKFTENVGKSFKENYPTVSATLAQVPRAIGIKPTEEQDVIFKGAIAEVAKGTKTIGLWAASELSKKFDRDDDTFLAGRKLTGKNKEAYKEYVQSGNKKIISKEVTNQINALKKIKKKVQSVKNYKNKADVLKQIDSLIDKSSRIRASKSAREVFDEFNVGSEFDFDFEKEISSGIDRMSSEIEFENVLDSLNRAPSYY